MGLRGADLGAGFVSEPPSGEYFRSLDFESSA